MVDITINKNMMNNKIVLISKDALCKAYLPVYGNKYNKMPNLMELAKKGTVFNRYYTAAPSSAMSYMSMFTGKHAYETNRKDYSPIQSKHNEIPNMCDEFASNGYECHILWDRRWYENAYMYSKCFGRENPPVNPPEAATTQPAEREEPKSEDQQQTPSLERTRSRPSAPPAVTPRSAHSAVSSQTSATPRPERSRRSRFSPLQRTQQTRTTSAVTL